MLRNVRQTLGEDWDPHASKPPPSHARNHVPDNDSNIFREALATPDHTPSRLFSKRVVVAGCKQVSRSSSHRWAEICELLHSSDAYVPPPLLLPKQCKYNLVKECAERMGWSVSKHSTGTNGEGTGAVDRPEWDLFWTDTSVSLKRVIKIQGFQKINHFPGMHLICRKGELARTLRKMQREFPADYNFFPRTWVLPSDLAEFKAEIITRKVSSNPGGTCRKKKKRGRPYYIVKPVGSCQGKGIFLTSTWKGAARVGGEGTVAQAYVSNPLLIDGFKFDLRIYVLVVSCDPLTIMMHRGGLVRLCTHKYRAPREKNLRNTRMHLTNYAINKDSDKYVPPRGGETLFKEEIGTIATKATSQCSPTDKESVGVFSQGEHSLPAEEQPTSNPTKLVSKDGRVPADRNDRGKRTACGTSAREEAKHGDDAAVATSDDAAASANNSEARGGQDDRLQAEAKNSPEGSDGKRRDEGGSKRSLQWFFRWLEEEGRDARALWRGVANIVVKTLASAQPALALAYRSCFVGETRDTSEAREHDSRGGQGRCFELLGYDILVDVNLRPWLLEVNHSPSFARDTPLDHRIKQEVISDTMRVLNMRAGESRRRREKEAAQSKQRLYAPGGKGLRGSVFTTTPVPDAKIRSEPAAKPSDMGGFQLIYPPPEGEDSPRAQSIARFLETSQALLDRAIGGGVIRPGSSRLAVDPFRRIWNRGEDGEGGVKSPRPDVAEDSGNVSGEEKEEKEEKEEEGGIVGGWRRPYNECSRIRLMVSGVGVDQELFRRRGTELQQGGYSGGCGQLSLDHERPELTWECTKPPQQREFQEGGKHGCAWSACNSDKRAIGFVSRASSPESDIRYDNLPTHSKSTTQQATTAPHVPSELSNNSNPGYHRRGRGIRAAFSLHQWDAVANRRRPPALQHPTRKNRASKSVTTATIPGNPKSDPRMQEIHGNVTPTTIAAIGRPPTVVACSVVEVGKPDVTGLCPSATTAVSSAVTSGGISCNVLLRSRAGNEHERSERYSRRSLRPASATASTVRSVTPGPSGIVASAAGFKGVVHINPRRARGISVSGEVFAGHVLLDNVVVPRGDSAGSKQISALPKRPQSSYGRVESRAAESPPPMLCVRRLNHDTDIASGATTRESGKTSSSTCHRKPSLPVNGRTGVYDSSTGGQEGSGQLIDRHSGKQTPCSSHQRALPATGRRMSVVTLVSTREQQQQRRRRDRYSGGGDGCDAATSLNGRNQNDELICQAAFTDSARGLSTDIARESGRAVSARRAFRAAASHTLAAAAVTGHTSDGPNTGRHEATRPAPPNRVSIAAMKSLVGKLRHQPPKREGMIWSRPIGL